GYFRRVTRRCPRCGDYETYEEKKTDVNIAIHLFKLASKNKYDKLILVTGDSDIIPSILAVKDLYPAKKIGVAIPIGRRAEDLKSNCDFNFKIKEQHLASSMLPERITLQNGRIITRPVEWT
ncbi:MAG: NYN domain-containing protein, partial [Candidatus Dadabacteria bacterium]|nr:NYN domain-containing protein [Candidatus Dadabacteria bacterium]